MLGFAASGAWLARRPERIASWSPQLLASGSCLFGLGLVVATAIFYPAPSVEDLSVVSRPAFVLAFLSCVPLGLLYSVAFAGSGLVLGLLLSSPTLDTRRLYFLDLVGSAVGAVPVLPILSLIGAERAAMVAGLALLLGTWLLFPPPAGWVRRACLLAAAVVLAARAFPGDLAFGCATRGNRPWGARPPAIRATSWSTWPGIASRGSRSPPRRHPIPTGPPGPRSSDPTGRCCGISACSSPRTTTPTPMRPPTTGMRPRYGAWARRSTRRATWPARSSTRACSPSAWAEASTC